MEMRARPVGVIDAPLVLGGNVVGWTADEAALFRGARAFLDAGFQRHRHGRRLFALGARQYGRQSETVIGKWMKARGVRDRVVPITKVGQDMGEARQGPRPRPYPSPGGRPR